jgi:HD superfamily phosphohydrolase
MDLVADLVTGRRTMGRPGSGTIPGVLTAHGLDPEDVASLILCRFDRRRYLQQIIFGEVDADMLDYLQRDFYFTGVAFGHIETDRILSTMVLRDDQLVFLQKGLDAVRDFLLARLQMYSSVYLHKKTRIVDQMLLRAARRSILELGEVDRFYEMTDDELLSFLVKGSRDPWVRDMAWRVKFRQKLFAQVFRIDAASPTSVDERFLNTLRERGTGPAETASRLEREISADAGLEPGYVLVDLPLEAVRISEERFEKTGISFVDSTGRLRTLEELDPPFAAYLGSARPNRSLLTVACSPEHRSAVAQSCRKVFEAAVSPLFAEMEED